MFLKRFNAILKREPLTLPASIQISFVKTKALGFCLGANNPIYLDAGLRGRQLKIVLIHEYLHYVLAMNGYSRPTEAEVGRLLRKYRRQIQHILS